MITSPLAQPSTLRAVQRRILHHYVLTPRRRTQSYDGYDEGTPPAAAEAAGTAMRTWSLDPDLPDRAASLAYHLTAYAMRTAASHRYVLTASLGEAHAAISVQALRGRLVARPAPGDQAAISTLADRAVHLTLPAGLTLLAVITLPTPGPLQHPQLSAAG
ncbi:hypothetical protein ACIGQC_29825 [Streptomyces albidoflavus]